MIILGVCNANDSGAALIIDGVLVAAANEERFVRKKLFQGFPLKSIEWLLASQELSISDIDWVGCGAWAGMDSKHTLPRIVEDIYSQVEQTKLESKESVMQRMTVSGNRDTHFRDVLIADLLDIGFRRQQIIFCDHHYSHALTAFIPSPFEDAIVFCADGRGDHRSVTLWEANRSTGLKLIDMATELTSPGALYGLITKQLGFIPDRHEGKVTGLAARGSESKIYHLLKDIFCFDDTTGRMKSKIGDYYRPFLSADLPELRLALENHSREDIAYAVQRVLEESLSDFLVYNITKHPDKSVNLCLSGGCMGNVKLNYVLSQLPQIKNLYVYPSMGDGGNAVGGAIHVAMQETGLSNLDIPTVYLGPGYTDEECEAAAKEANLPYSLIPEGQKAQEVAKLIADGHIIGWFQGRMEYGPRSLGARSILASPCDARINDSLNERLQRSEFMPFAPATTDTLAPLCLVDWKPDQIAAEFMTICYKCLPIMQEKCAAVVHVDNSARPQVVFREKNPEYHDLIMAYYNITGVPAIINTSFNHHEEPILNSPQDALRSLLKGNVDILVMGNVVVRLSDVPKLPSSN